LIRNLGNDLARDRRPPAQATHGRAFRSFLLRQPHEFGVARGDGRQIEAVGFDDASGLFVPAAVAFAVDAAFYRDKAEFDWSTVGFLIFRPKVVDRVPKLLGMTVSPPP
jgi:hypothetical protein